jgi:hypothetical protein
LNFDPNFFSVRDNVGGGIKPTVGLCGVEWDYEGRKCNDDGLKTLVINILFNFDLSL